MPNFESISSPENKKIPRNIFELSPEEWDGFQKRTEKFDGLARILVHPFFRLPYLDEEKESKIIQIRTLINHIFDIEPETSPPIIVFEEEALSRQMQWYATKKNQPYIVPTFREDPAPKIDPLARDPIVEMYSKDIRDESHDQENWQKLIDILHSLGVKKMIIGGVKLQVFPFRFGESAENVAEHYGYRLQRKAKGVGYLSYSIDGCVGDTVKRFASNFEIELSHLSFPDSRRNIIDLESGQEK